MSVLTKLFSQKSSSARLPGSAEIEAELIAERTSLSQAEPVLATLVDKRRRMLLIDTPTNLIEAVEGEIQVAQRTRDRHAARVEALETALADAVAREQDAEIQRIYDEAAEKIEAARKWQAERYEPLARELAEGFRLLFEADRLAESAIEIPEGCAPLMGPSSDRHSKNMSHEHRLYADTRRLQALNVEDEPLWMLPIRMLPY